MSDLTIVFTTWPNHEKRWEYFMTCAPRVIKMLKASNHKIEYACVSESARDPLHTWYGPELKNFCISKNIPLTFRNAKPNLGAMMNSAMEFNSSPLMMIVQDDWYITEECDLSPGIKLMQDHSQIDIIRYSWPESLGVTVKGEFAGWRKLDPNGMWPYGDDPHIRRSTFVQKFGEYITYGHHGASEGDMVYRFGNRDAFILLADKCYFGHCGEVSAVINDERERAVSR